LRTGLPRSVGCPSAARLPERQRGDRAFCFLIKRLNGRFLARGRTSLGSSRRSRVLASEIPEVIDETRPRYAPPAQNRRGRVSDGSRSYARSKVPTSGGVRPLWSDRSTTRFRLAGGGRIAAADRGARRITRAAPIRSAQVGHGQRQLAHRLRCNLGGLLPLAILEVRK
jgi:hypothetical protein